MGNFISIVRKGIRQEVIAGEVFLTFFCILQTFSLQIRIYLTYKKLSSKLLNCFHYMCPRKDAS